MPLTTPDGKPVQLDEAERKFAAAMAAPAPDPDLPAPPKREPVPDDGKKPAEKRAPRAAQKPRPKSAPDPKADYSEPARELVTGAWTLTAAIPYTAPYAVVIADNAAALAPALAEGAKHSEVIRQWVSGTGENVWKVHLGLVAAQMCMTAWQIAKNPDLRKACAERTQAELLQMAQAAQEATANGSSAAG